MNHLEPLFGVLKNMDPTNRAGIITLGCIIAGVLIFASGVQIGKLIAMIN